MDHTPPAIATTEDETAAADLAHRLGRLRRRVAAEGRPRSLRLIERAIEDVKRKPD